MLLFDHSRPADSSLLPHGSNFLGAALAFCAMVLLGLAMLNETGTGNRLMLASLAACALAAVCVMLLVCNRRRILALQASRAELERAQAVAHVGSWYLASGGGPIEWSPETCRIFGVAEGTPIRLADFFMFVHPEDLIRVEHAWQAAQRGKGYDLVHRIVVAGEVRWVHERAQLRFDGNGNFVSATGTVQDITDRQRIEAELCHSRQRLRELGAHHEQMMEDERAHVAREIHDELGQYLTTLRMDAAMLQLSFGAQDARLHQRLGEMKSLIDDTIRSVRRVSGALRPTVLDLGLEPAIEWLVDEFAQRSGLSCSLDLPAQGLPHVDECRAVPVFRILQEALTNVVRHAQASHVGVELSTAGEQLQLEVRDDGIGFDASVSRSARHFGVLGMTERAAALGGTLSWSSTPERGTTVTLVIPLEAPAEAAPPCRDCPILRPTG